MRRRRIALGCAIAGVFLVLVAALAPGLAARRVAQRLSATLGTPIDVGWLSWNPLTGSWILRGFRIAADRGPAALVSRRITASLRLWDLVRGRYRVRSLVVDGARLRLRATADGWSLPLPAQPAEGGGSASAWPPLELDWAAAPRAVVRLEPRANVRSQLRMRRLELSGAIGSAGLHAMVWTRGRLDRGSVAFAGRLRSDATSRRIRLRLAAADLDLARIIRLAPAAAIGDLRGRVDVRAKYDEGGRGDQVERRAVGTASGRDVALRAHGVDGLWLRGVALSRFDVDLDRHAVALGTVRLREPEVWLRRSGTTFAIAGLDQPTGDASTRWNVTVAGSEASGGAVHAIDADTGEQTLDVALEDLRTGAIGPPDGAVPFSIAATIGSGGRIAARGELVRTPPQARLNTTLGDVALPPLLAMTPTPLRIESGRLSGTLDASVAATDLTASGSITVSDVKTISPNPAHPEDVMAFKEMRVAIRTLRSEPRGVVLDRLEVDWPYVLIDRMPDGIFPLTFAAVPVPTAGGGFATIRVNELRVIGGRIDFRDALLEPPYWRALANLTLTARGVEPTIPRVAELDASGLVDEISPLHVEGTIGERTHLVAEVQHLALPPFNAYLAGARTYTVSSGALTARSEIRLERSELEVDNRIVLSRLGLSGRRNEDLIQHEVGVPLTLALALMKDYRGNIELDLPFGGNLKEPTFSMRAIILQAIVRAVRGAILSPLNALGRVFVREGRVEHFELDAIPFAPGERALDARGGERLAQVAHVLASHPELAVRLQGAVGSADVERLQEDAALSALVDAREAEPLRAFLRARRTGTPLPALDAAQRSRLDALRDGLPWPAEALYELASDRGAVSRAGLIVDQHVDPARTTVDPPARPAPAEVRGDPRVDVDLATAAR